VTLKVWIQYSNQCYYNKCHIFDHLVAYLCFLKGLKHEVISTHPIALIASSDFVKYTKRGSLSTDFYNINGDARNSLIFENTYSHEESNLNLLDFFIGWMIDFVFLTKLGIIYERNACLPTNCSTFFKV